jgi:transcriptional regulator with XRE-family HTH domain
MSTKLNDTQNIKEAFDQLFNSFTAEEIIESEARLIMFRFLEIIERRSEMLGWNRKQLAEKVGTSASYITQLFRGDKLINMITLAKFQKALGLEFEIAEKKSYEEKVKEYAPISDGNGVWVYFALGKPNYDSKDEIPAASEDPFEIAA